MRQHRAISAQDSHCPLRVGRNNILAEAYDSAIGSSGTVTYLRHATQAMDNNEPLITDLP